MKPRSHDFRRFSNRQKFREAKKTPPKVLGKAGQYIRRAQVVDFTLFRSEYWRQFPTNLTRDYEPSLVFAEVREKHTYSLGNVSRVLLTEPVRKRG